MRANPELISQDEVLERLAHAVERELGFSMVVVNLFRPETDDYKVMVMRGPDDLRDAIDGESLSRKSWMDLFDSKFERFGTFFVPEGEGEWGDAPVYEPEEDAGEGEHRWRKGDALFVPIRCQGAILGILCVDGPRHGERPSDWQLLKLSALADRAGRAFEGE